ncbi:MAG: hypothetical protein Q4D26_11040 [Clostridia bacterium]|nr:hypothetical protein [Clostridia bacterium]
MDIMISITPPYTKMILSGYKPVEYRKKILKNIKLLDKVYIYETKNNNGQGKVIGATVICDIYKLYYSKSVDDNIPTPIVQERLRHIKNLYYNYCYMKSYKPNNNEGWFKSKKFLKYQQKIGFFDDYGELKVNYAINFAPVKKFDEPLDISNFICPISGNILKQPPKNMCYVDIIL